MYVLANDNHLDMHIFSNVLQEHFASSNSELSIYYASKNREEKHNKKLLTFYKTYNKAHKHKGRKSTEVSYDKNV